MTRRTRAWAHAHFRALARHPLIFLLEGDVQCLTARLAHLRSHTPAAQVERTRSRPLASGALQPAQAVGEWACARTRLALVRETRILRQPQDGLHAHLPAPAIRAPQSSCCSAPRRSVRGSTERTGHVALCHLNRRAARCAAVLGPRHPPAAQRLQVGSWSASASHERPPSPRADVHRAFDHPLCAAWRKRCLVQPHLRSKLLGASSLLLVASYPLMKRVTHWVRCRGWSGRVGHASRVCVRAWFRAWGTRGRVG